MSCSRLVMYTFVANGISLPELESYTMSDLRRLFWERNLPVLDIVLNLHDLIHSPRGGQPRLDVPRLSTLQEQITWACEQRHVPLSDVALADVESTYDSFVSPSLMWLCRSYN